MSLRQEFTTLLQTVEQRLLQSSGKDREALRVEVLGRKGMLANLFDKLKGLQGVERSETGKVANEIRSKLFSLLEDQEPLSTFAQGKDIMASLGWTKKGVRPGFVHPLTQFMEKVQTIFASFGFDIIDSGELENEEYNFDLLNIPKDHPARDSWDTFFVRKPGRKTDALLRTHTSPMQLRAMKKRKPPVRIIVPGRVFRREATDASHGSVFYQCEGFLIDRGITLTDLMGTLSSVLQTLFGADAKIRFRPHYYSFVEPGMDVDMLFARQGESQPRWLEMLGSGIIHPKVLENMGVNPKVFSGFAFGLGIDRLAMLYFGIEDIRDLYSGDLQFINQ